MTYIEAFEAANRDDLTTGFSTQSLGWWPQTAEIVDGAPAYTDFILPTGAVRSSPVVFLPTTSASLLSGVGVSGTLKGWFAAFRRIQHLPLMFMGPYAAVASILLPIVDCPAHTLSLAGDSGAGKSTLLYGMASVWGRPTRAGGFVGSWDDTINSIEAQCGVLGNLPIIIDETQRMRDRSLMIQMIYNQWQGSGRTRMRADASLRSQNKWHNILAASGEGSILTLSGDDRLRKGGIAARVLEVTGRFTGPEAEAGRLEADLFTREIREHYGHLGPLVVELLLDERERWPGMVEFYEQTCQEIAARYDLKDSATGGRLAAYTAALMLAAEIVHGASIEMPLPNARPAEFIISATLGEGVLADRYVQIMHRLRAWLQSNQHRFWGRHAIDDGGLPRQPYGGWVGRWEAGDDWKNVYILEGEFSSWASTRGFSPAELVAGWASRGWLYGKQPKYQVSAAIGNMKLPCYAIPRSVVENLPVE